MREVRTEEVTVVGSFLWKSSCRREADDGRFTNSEFPEEDSSRAGLAIFVTNASVSVHGGCLL